MKALHPSLVETCLTCLGAGGFGDGDLHDDLYQECFDCHGEGRTVKTIIAIMAMRFDREWPIVLTAEQKLHALANRFYARQEWIPRAGDLYTTSRADLELYQITRIEHGDVYTTYRDPDRGASESAWPQEEFLSPKTFGYARVYVPNWIMIL